MKCFMYKSVILLAIICMATAPLSVYASEPENWPSSVTIYVADGITSNGLTLTDTAPISARGWENGGYIQWREVKLQLGWYNVSAYYATRHENITFETNIAGFFQQMTGTHPYPDGETFYEVELGKIVASTVLVSLFRATGDRNAQGSLMDLHSLTFTFIEEISREEQDRLYLRSEWGPIRRRLADFFDNYRDPETNDFNNRAIGIFALGLLGVIIAFIIVLRYISYLKHKYEFSLLNATSTIMIAIVSIYRFIGFVFPSFTTSWGFLTAADAFGFRLEPYQMNMPTLILASPFLVLHLILTVKQLKNIIHAIFATAIMAGIALLAGYIGMVIGVVVFIIIGLFYIRLLFSVGLSAMKPSTHLKCLHCGKVYKKGQTHECT